MATQVQTKPHPAQLEAFGKLVNKMGLVPMKIIRPFAPYLKDDIAGFDAENAARLFVRKEGVPVNAKGEIIAIDEPPPEHKEVPLEKIEIPLNWADLHQLQLTRLAKQILGDATKKLNVDEAKEVIVAELKRREDHAAESHED